MNICDTSFNALFFARKRCVPERLRSFGFRVDGSRSWRDIFFCLLPLTREEQLRRIWWIRIQVKNMCCIRLRARMEPLWAGSGKKSGPF